MTSSRGMFRRGAGGVGGESGDSLLGSRSAPQGGSGSGGARYPCLRADAVQHSVGWMAMAVGSDVLLTDPRELLEVYDPEGNPTGEAKTRGTVHLEGHWHLAFFCWIARPGARDVEI